jgi:hypothetical protein
MLATRPLVAREGSSAEFEVRPFGFDGSELRKAILLSFLPRLIMQKLWSLCATKPLKNLL